MSYKDDLRHAKWQQKRLLVFERDNFKCTVGGCSTPQTFIQVHHLEYLPGLKPWEYPMDMLVTLCENHHKQEQHRVELERHFATTLRMKGFLMSDLLAFSCKIDTDEKFTQSLLKILRRMQNG